MIVQDYMFGKLFCELVVINIKVKYNELRTDIDLAD